MCEICSELTVKTPDSVIFIVNFEHISHLFPMFLLLTLNKRMLARIHRELSRVLDLRLCFPKCQSLRIVTIFCYN